VGGRDWDKEEVLVCAYYHASRPEGQVGSREGGEEIGSQRGKGESAYRSSQKMGVASGGEDGGQREEGAPGSGDARARRRRPSHGHDGRTICTLTACEMSASIPLLSSARVRSVLPDILSPSSTPLSSLLPLPGRLWRASPCSARPEAAAPARSPRPTA
jgi:hypothetical protein